MEGDNTSALAVEQEGRSAQALVGDNTSGPALEQAGR